MSCSAIAFLVALIASSVANAQQVETAAAVEVFNAAPIGWSESAQPGEVRHGFRTYREGQLIDAVVELPPMPANQRDAHRITATLKVEPMLEQHNGMSVAADPWPRLGSVLVGEPRQHRTQSGKGAKFFQDEPKRSEIMRFVTGFGGATVFEQDVTAYAPLLAGRTRIGVFISTYKDPGWKVSLTFTYSKENAGDRRPVWAMPVLFEEQITAERHAVQTSLVVPKGLDRPRLHIISTGHATDGQGGDEFVSRTHILRVDGKEVARWRPWSESGGSLRVANPMSGKEVMDGRQRWSSDQDRSGWHPGGVVEPLRIPLPELTPGKHTIEVEIVGIRSQQPSIETSHYGYWRLSAIAVADEPWPASMRAPQTPATPR